MGRPDRIDRCVGNPLKADDRADKIRTAVGGDIMPDLVPARFPKCRMEALPQRITAAEIENDARRCCCICRAGRSDRFPDLRYLVRMERRSHWRQDTGTSYPTPSQHSRVLEAAAVPKPNGRHD